MATPRRPTPGVDYPRTAKEFEARFPTEEACRGFLVRLRWPDGYDCPSCGHTEPPWITARGYLHCRDCQGEISPTAGTLFVRIWHDEDLDVRVNMGPVFFRILHEGRTFQRGLRRHFDRQLQALATAAGLPDALRARLPEHRVEVLDGKLLQVGDSAGAVRFRDDLVHLATRHDYRTTEGMAELLRESGLAR